MAARRDFIWVSGGRLAAALIALVSIRLSTTLLPPEQYGLLAILVTFQTFCGLFIVNPLGQYINRHTHEWADDGTLLPRLRRYRQYVMIAGMTGGVAVGAWPILQPLLWTERLLQVIAVTAMVVAATWNATSVGMLNMLGQRAASVVWATTTAFTSLLLSWLLVRESASGLAWFFGQAAGMALGAVGAGRAVRRHLGSRVPPAGDWPLIDADGIRAYALPLAIATGFMWWLLSGYRLQVERYWGLAALGYATVGLGLVGQLWGLCESLAMQFLFPLYFKRIAGTSLVDGRLAFSDLLNTLGPQYLVLAAVTLPSASALLMVFVANAYGDAYRFVWLGALVECCRVLGNVLGNAAQVERRMIALIWPYALGALALGTGLAVAAAAGWPLEQGLVALALAGAVTLLAMFVQMRRVLGYTLDRWRWGFAALLLAASALLSLSAPLQPHSMGGALMVIGGAGGIAAVSLLALLWKNPATVRLLAVQLHPAMKGA